MHCITEKALSRSERHNTLKIIAIYAIFSFLWIYLSDTVLSLVFTDPKTITEISVFKGSLFVIITSILLYNLVSRYLFVFTQLKKEIKKSEQLFNLLSEGMMDAYTSVDMTGRILQFNEVYRNMLGYEEEELRSMVYKDFTPEKWHSIEHKIIEEQVISRGYSDIYEKEYRRKNGTVFPVELRAQLVRDDQGNPVLMWAIIRDITERKLAEEKLNNKSEQLEELNRSLEKRVEGSIIELREKDQVLIQQSRLAAMGEMISNIAHQWRQPLNVLGLHIQSLKVEYGIGQMNKESLDKSVEESMSLIRHMSTTIDDFRTFFKPEKEQEDFKVCQTVARAVQLVKASFDSKHIKLVMTDCNEDVDIHGYPNEYSQVVLNILVNAKEAMETSKTANPQVTITVVAEDGTAIVTISDNAGGIPEEIIHKVFDPHFSTKGPQGTGIGLFMAKNIIEKNMNGRLSVRNNGEGAEFKIEV
jgi:PAS domain S-box-containing protein